MQTNIYDMLKEGRSAEDLVAEFTAALNEAEARVQAEKDAEAEAAAVARQAELQKIEKRDTLIYLLEDFADFVAEYYPELMPEENYDCAELTDSIIALLDSLSNPKSLDLGPWMKMMHNFIF
jgi:hypothetical protein